MSDTLSFKTLFLTFERKALILKFIIIIRVSKLNLSAGQSSRSNGRHLFEIYN